ncbi:MAG TPA: TetR/AcrR family transcriptional regulator [Candidatus Fournierella excrementigallinarum]|nr:TetR/AcrR family transcriptional regulator [Candidatus Fournierella excrementigallinarum]
MPKVAYSEAQREQIRQDLVAVGLELMTKQGIQRTTVEQIYQKVGISRSFFYTFFPTKEDLVVEMLYLQQPRVVEHARRLLADPALDWRQAVTQFLRACCYGERNGIAVLTVEEQQKIFHRLSPESYQSFRQKQQRLFGQLMKLFGVRPEPGRVSLFTNLCLAVMVIQRAIPGSLPLLVPEAADATIDVQISSIVDWLASLRAQDAQGE